MANYNRVVLMGHLTRDVELKYLQSGMAVAEIGLAVNERRKTQAGEWVDDPVFVDITLWGRTAEVASEYLSKGSAVLIEGRLKYDTWEKDGKKMSKLRVTGERMQMVGPRTNAAGGSGRGPSMPNVDEHETAGAMSADSNGGFNRPTPVAGPPGEPEADIPF